MTENTVTISIATYEALKDNQVYFEANLENKYREQLKTLDEWKKQYRADCKIAMIIKETNTGDIKEIEINDAVRVEWMLKRVLSNEIYDLQYQLARKEQSPEDKWYSPLLNLFK